MKLTIVGRNYRYIEQMNLLYKPELQEVLSQDSFFRILTAKAPLILESRMSIIYFMKDRKKWYKGSDTQFLYSNYWMNDSALFSEKTSKFYESYRKKSI